MRQAFIKSAIENGIMGALRRIKREDVANMGERNDDSKQCIRETLARARTKINSAFGFTMAEVYWDIGRQIEEALIGDVASDIESLRNLAEQLKAEKTCIMLGRIELNTCGLIETTRIFEILGWEAPAQINEDGAVNLAMALEKLGYGIIPDIRYHGVKPEITSQVAVFLIGHGANINPSEEFRRVITIIRMATLVAKTDCSAIPETGLFWESLIWDNKGLTANEKNSLQAYQQWCLNMPQGTTDIKLIIADLKQMIAGLSPNAKNELSHSLIVAPLADPNMSSDEAKQLENLCANLGLVRPRELSRPNTTTIPDDTVVDATSTDEVIADNPVSVAGQGQALVFDTSHSQDDDPGLSLEKEIIGNEEQLFPGLQLDEDQIRKKEQETLQIRNILENIFTEDLDEDEDSHFELDQAHRALMVRLMEQEYWERPIVNEICTELGLMPGGALEVLNEWAFAKKNESLIEDENPLYFNTELAREIIDA